MTVSLDMLKTIKGGMSILRLYLYIKKRDAKVKWSKDRDAIAKDMGVTLNNLRGIKRRALALGVLKAGGKDWIFAVGNRAWLKDHPHGSKRKLYIREALWNDAEELRTLIAGAFISNVVWEYGTVVQRGRAVMPCSISYLMSTLGWSRYKVLKYRKRAAEVGHFNLTKDWQIFASTRFGQSEKEVRAVFFRTKELMRFLSGDDFRIAKTLILHKKGEVLEALYPSSSIISTSLRCKR